MWTNWVWEMGKPRRAFEFGTWTTEWMMVVTHQYKKFKKMYIE